MAIISPIHRFVMCKYIKCVNNNRREQSKVERVIYFYAWLLTTLKLQSCWKKKTFSAEIGSEKWFANWGPKSDSSTNSILNLNFESCRTLLFKSNTNSTNYIYNFYSRTLDFPQIIVGHFSTWLCIRIRSHVVISRTQYKILTN